MILIPHLNKIDYLRIRNSKFKKGSLNLHINNWTLVGKNDLPLLIEVTLQ